MADFAVWVTACETKFWPASTFKTAYATNRADVVDDLIEADPAASAVRLLMANRGLWEGQASELDAILRAITGRLARAENSPAEPQLLANRLRQVAASLMKIGIVLKFHKSRDRGRETHHHRAREQRCRQHDFIHFSVRSVHGSGRACFRPGRRACQRDL